ncbi:AAA family ATPase [Flavobacterium oreochromis]|uniref:AAA family ATPase n=1 Tax=Flavobacterium oreochromis TaxID=2906078 RepID=UPI00385CC2EF
MRIRELTIKNFRVLEDDHFFEFNSNITLIAGVNGKGKTAILDALVLVLSRLVPQISPSKSRRIKIKEFDITIGKEAMQLALKTNCAGHPVNFTIDYTTKEISTKLTKKVREQIANAYGDPQRGDDQAPLAVFYTTDRAGYKFPKKLPDIVLSGQAMAYNGALVNRLVDYKDLMYRYKVASNTETTFNQNTIDAINSAISQFMENFGDLHVETNPLRLVIKKGEKNIDVKQLSDGERAFIALISDLGRRLALANPALANPLLGYGVVLIDEIELHLHPKWQLELLENLRNIFPNIQFILTTHSPFIIQTAREGELISLDNEIVVDPYGKSLEEVSKYVMNIQNTEYSPRIKEMKAVAEKYLALSKEYKEVNDERKAEIQIELAQLLAPFSDNPAYVALLESKGISIDETNK